MCLKDGKKAGEDKIQSGQPLFAGGFKGGDFLKV